MGAFAGLGLDGGFVGLASEVGVTGASGAGGLDTEQPMFRGSRQVSRSAASSRALEGPRVERHVCVVERLPFVRRAQYKSGQLNAASVSTCALAHPKSRRWPS